MIFNWFLRLFDKGLLGGIRSPKWEKVRKDFLAAHPTCEVCGKKGEFLKPLNVHHVQVFHKFPAEELNPENLITLCPVHHLWWGHLGNFKSWNDKVREDATEWKIKIQNRP